MAAGPFRLAHFTDAHLPTHGGFRLGELLGKRGLGALNWARKRRKQHLLRVADALAADIAAHRPDHVAMTGDAVNFGLPREYQAAAAWLGRFEAELSFVPGNHEALTGAHSRALHEAYAPWATGDGGEGFPYLRRRGGVALIGLSSAIPTPPTFAYGRLGAAQIEAAAAHLRAAEGLFRILLIHHPPGPTTPKRRELKDRAALGAMLREVGAEMILYGHNHRAELTPIKGPVGPIPALAAPSASTPVGAGREPAEWRLIEIAPQDQGWTAAVTRRAIQADGAFGATGRFTLTAPRPLA